MRKFRLMCKRQSRILKAFRRPWLPLRKSQIHEMSGGQFGARARVSVCCTPLLLKLIFTSGFLPRIFSPRCRITIKSSYSRIVRTEIINLMARCKGLLKEFPGLGPALCKTQKFGHSLARLFFYISRPGPIGPEAISTTL